MVLPTCFIPICYSSSHNCITIGTAGRIQWTIKPYHTTENHNPTELGFCRRKKAMFSVQTEFLNKVFASVKDQKRNFFSKYHRISPQSCTGL